MMTSTTPVNPYNSMQICLNVENIIFSLVFSYFKDISDEVTSDDDLTCMMTSSLIYCVDHYF